MYIDELDKFEMKVIGLVGLTFLCVYAQNARVLTRRCSNPNDRSGVCVPIEDCQTLWSVLQRKPLQLQDEQFLRASKCNTNYANSEYLVCCSSDTGFIQIQPNYDENFFWPYFPSPTEQKPQYSSTVAFPRNEYEFTRRRVRINQLKRSRNTTHSLLPTPPNCGNIAFGNRIYGGENADLFEFPWMVLFEYQNNEGKITIDCAGSLINNRYVLTAAHCVKGSIKRNKQLVAVRLGEHDTTSQIDCDSYSCAPEAYRVAIEETVPHKLYNDHNQDNDIALVRLSQSIKFREGVKPICLPRNGKTMNIDSGTQFTVAGWGQTLKEPTSAIKQKLSVEFVDQQKCSSQFLEKKVIIKDTQICAGGKFAEDSCRGDSGGPLMRIHEHAWVLEGIVSFGNKCGRLNWPAVHTKVLSYVDWIQSQLRT